MGLLDDLLSSIGLIPSDEEKNLLRIGERTGEADAEAIEQDTELRRRLEEMLGGLGDNGRPPTFRLDLRNPTDIDEFIQGIAPTGELEGLFRLLGAGRPGSGSGIAAGSQGLGLQQGRRENLERLARALLMGIGGGDPSTGSIGGGVSSGPNFGGSVSGSLPPFNLGGGD